MINLTINDIKVSVPTGTNILEAAAKAGVEIPHLCYLKDINEIGACRLCSVEVEGADKLVSACENKVTEGMVVHTDSEKVRKSVKTNLEFILSRHNKDCDNCVRNNSCALQKLVKQYGLEDSSFKKQISVTKNQWNMSFPLIKDESKCIKCMRCIQICNKVQSLGIWDTTGAAGRTKVGVANSLKIENSVCSACGQCITHCPVGALRERDDVDNVIEKLQDHDVTTVVQIAPAVRTAFCEAFGLSPEKGSVNLIAGALRKAGFDFVFDTSFSADLTIMEEGSEFLERLKNGDLSEFPMFTSCCPGWVRFVKSQFPSLVKQLSSAKSPQQMFGSIMKTYFAKERELNPSKICTVSIMPCTAKKAECDMPNMKDSGYKDVDYVLTTREVARLINRLGIDISKVKEVEFDSLMKDYTGAGVIFGATGGVMEAALRSAYYLVTGKNPDADAFKAVRADKNKKPWREAEFEIAGTKLKVAVTSSLSNARALCTAIVNKEVKYDFVEIMACPGGCVGGGGQIIHADDKERASERGKILYSIDKKHSVRFSHENKDISKMYASFLGKPLSEKSEKLLHTNHLE